ncbi:MAG: transglutaminase domain-containing protein [Bacteroidales bacterium]|nr:transglutaminase domain-containing protein [Bacteroidales bacterium]
MRNILIFFLLLSVHICTAQYTKYNNTFTILRSNRIAFTSFTLVAPCPHSDDYQDIYNLDLTSAGKWNQQTIAENQNQYVELCMNAAQLSSIDKDFKVGYSFIFFPKTIEIDFSRFKNADGTWKDMPEYDTTTNDYKDNCKRSGEFVVPDNSIIKSLSDSLFEECGKNRLAYTEHCYNYVASNYKYLNPFTGLHTLSKILKDGGGDCGNLSSIYISLLRAKGIPARHVVAFAANNNFHVWAEFYIQDFGWVPVDVTYKNGNPRGNYFGRYNYNMVIVQKGAFMDYNLQNEGTKTLELLQTYYYWYWYSVYATLSVSQQVFLEKVENIDNIPLNRVEVSIPKTKKVLKNNRMLIEKGRKNYYYNGVLAP